MVAIIGFLLPMVFMIGFMWLLMVRPQQKKQQAHLELLSNLKTGDSIETIGGICGKVVLIEDDFVTILSDKSNLKIKKVL